MKQRFLTLAALVMMVGFAWGCSGSGDKNNDATEQETTQENASGLTDFQMKNGIGPVTEELDLGPIDEDMAERGEKLFKTNCSACHKLDERYVGPAQRDLVERRSPEYIMNMILNPAEMLEKHPEAKKMLAQFMTPMPNQNLSREEARAVLEYFRYVDTQKPDEAQKVEN